MTSPYVGNVCVCVRYDELLVMYNYCYYSRITWTEVRRTMYKSQDIFYDFLFLY